MTRRIAGLSNPLEAHMDPLSPFEEAALTMVPADAVIQCAARADACVLIIGRASAALAIASSIHQRSGRASGPLTVLDCHNTISVFSEETRPSC